MTAKAVRMLTDYKKVFLSSLLLSLVIGIGYYFYYSLPDVTVLKQKNPRTTALMDLRDRVQKKARSRSAQTKSGWRAGAISEHLKKAILISEDAAFFSHKGIDLNELKAALKKDWETMSFSRGASTITMQLAKNLYLNPLKNPLGNSRKLSSRGNSKRICRNGASWKSISTWSSGAAISTVRKPPHVIFWQIGRGAGSAGIRNLSRFAAEST